MKLTTKHSNALLSYFQEQVNNAKDDFEIFKILDFLYDNEFYSYLKKIIDNFVEDDDNFKQMLEDKYLK